jgi:hypothetical protein
VLGPHLNLVVCRQVDRQVEQLAPPQPAALVRQLRLHADQPGQCRQDSCATAIAAAADVVVVAGCCTRADANCQRGPPRNEAKRLFSALDINRQHSPPAAVAAAAADTGGRGGRRAGAEGCCCLLRLGLSPAARRRRRLFLLLLSSCSGLWQPNSCSICRHRPRCR